MDTDPKSDSQPSAAGENDFELRHNLRDTIILLGGKTEIADLLVKSQDGLISKADIDVLRNYNISLFTKTKTALARLNRLRIQTTG
jgi:hypothetical protein